MRAYREQNFNQGVNILTQADFDAIAVASRGANVLYIVGTVDTTANTVDISSVWVGNNRQNFLVNNAGALVWVGNVDDTIVMPAAITGFTNAPVPLNELV